MYGEIIEKVDIRIALEFYGIKFNHRRFAICPFHQEKTPSFTYFKKNSTFQCMGCKCGGDIINFVAKMYGINNYNASKKISNDFNLGIFKEKITEREKNQYREFVKKRDKKREEHEKKMESIQHLHRVYAELDKICMDNKPDEYGPNMAFVCCTELKNQYWELIQIAEL